MSAKIRFARPGAFSRTLKKRVYAHLEAEGRPRHGGWRIAVKAAVILAFLAASYIALVFVASGIWQVALSAFLVGQGIILVGFNVMHDAGHNAFSDKRWVNRTMARTLDLVGGNQDLWRIKHNTLHHSYTNIDSHDDDLDTRGLLRLHPDQPWRVMHRFQAWYAPLLYCFLFALWVVSDVSDHFTARIGKHAIKKPGAGQTAMLLGMKAVFLTLALGIPLALHPWWAVLACLSGIMASVGLVTALVFQLAHVVDKTTFVSRPDDAGETHHVEDTWMVHQLKTTADFAVKNPLVTFYCGGLNFQTMHHLFSNISHVHYRSIQPVVVQTCAEFGVPYAVYPSVPAAIAGHFRALAQLARRPADTCEAQPTEAPAERSETREALSAPWPHKPLAGAAQP